MRRMHTTMLKALLDGKVTCARPLSSMLCALHQAKLCTLAGKLAVLEALLACILDAERLRCIVVSSSTVALDLVGSLCTARGWATVRIDGATNPAARQEVVDGFNLYSRGQARDIAASTSCAVQHSHLIVALRCIMSSAIAHLFWEDQRQGAKRATKCA